MKIFAVIVTYNPDMDSFIRNLSAILGQVDTIIIVDNSNEENYQISLKNHVDNISNVILIQPNENLGIAYAQNIGFMQSLKLNADFVITFDQDSSVDSDLIEVLYSE
ncbi:glycosyltransferase, partial [Escherichia coli]|nr:glycosyltransferase [Escherichia coli]